MIQFKDSRLVIFGQRVRSLREQKGWTAREVASRGKISATELAAIEEGRKNFGFTTFLELCRILEIAPSELLDFDMEA